MKVSWRNSGRLTWLHTPDWDGVVPIAAYSMCIVCAQCVWMLVTIPN